MAPPFFPTLVFGWVFFATLVGILLISSWVDVKRMVIPKWLTLPALGLGLGFNVVRGAMLGFESSRVWQLESGGPLIGALDGLLFSAAGFAIAFGLFFVFWLVGVCGGGDVKLCAAVGAWIGPGSGPPPADHHHPHRGSFHGGPGRMGIVIWQLEASDRQRSNGRSFGGSPATKT